MMVGSSRRTRPLRRPTCPARRRWTDRDTATCSVCRLKRAPPHSLQVTYRSGRKFISIFVVALALARFAAAAFDVEAEAAGPVAALLGIAGAGEDLADFVEHAGVGGRIAARRAADRRLVNLDHLVDLARAAQARVRARLGGDAAQAGESRRGPAFR